MAQRLPAQQVRCSGFDNITLKRQVWTLMLHILFYCSEYNTFHIKEIYLNTIQNRGRKHCAPILTGLHVRTLFEHEIGKTFMECNNYRDCLYICASSFQRIDSLFKRHELPKFEIRTFFQPVHQHSLVSSGAVSG